jgi:peroxiredoxin
LKQDYPKILRAGAELVLVSPDSLAAHRKYALDLFAEEFPFLTVSDTTLEIARSYSLLREHEHPHGGFYYRSLWVIDRDGMIAYKSVPWDTNRDVEAYQRLFRSIGSEPGQWIARCGLINTEPRGDR